MTGTSGTSTECSSRSDGPLSREDFSSSDDGPAQPCLSPSLSRDGPMVSVGSAEHPDTCKACAFYCFTHSGCRNGVDCTYCHLSHESKLRQRRDEWKKAQRHKRKELRKAAKGTDSPQEVPETLPMPKIAYCEPQARRPQLVECGSAGYALILMARGAPGLSMECFDVPPGERCTMSPSYVGGGRQVNNL
mmetsp:Transcript_24800/g.65103  ORF Transcript_24800/g.65103 Transcript_24800/m.65103 type:complete len:190 (-) Transcript_24800:607-1176(-)